ncbi:MAG: hypothetical protein OXT69_07200 [Candidatus Poribacteria bacterium]|nr:hypothetical protein [Candidatus Poribacteria bacterium]
MTIWTPQGADTKRFALRLVLFTAALAAVAVGGWFLSTAAHSAAPNPNKCQCIPENGLEFKTWKVGQAPFDSMTFITNEETKCAVYAEVGYIDDTDAHISPIQYEWEAEMTHGFEFEEEGWSIGCFILFAVAEGPKHSSQACPGNGRANAPMGIDLTYSAKFKCESDCSRCSQNCPWRDKCKTLSCPLELKQDPIDEIRQEYVDHGLTVPDRMEFVAKDSLYAPSSDPPNWMVDRGMQFYLEHWAKHCTFKMRENLMKLRGMSREEANEYVITADNLPINSGYRNPEHNWEHVRAQGYNSVWLSRHQFGDALDVSAAYVDMNGDKKYGKTADKIEMVKAAKKSHEFLGVKGHSYYKSHVHSDWRP